MSVWARSAQYLPPDVVSFLRGTKRKAVDRLKELRLRVEFGPVVAGVARRIQQESLTYCTPQQLVSLIRLCREVERLPGTPPSAAIIEAGCARGGSAILLCAAKSLRRPLRLYDVFGLLPAPTERDSEDLRQRYQVVRAGQAEGLGGQKYYAYEDDLEAVVKSNFHRLGFPLQDNNVQTHKGLVQDTLTGSDPVCLAHIDVDNFDAVHTCLERIVPRLVPGGAAVIHAYYNWGSARQATDAYFRQAGQFTFDGSAGHMIIRKSA